MDLEERIEKLESLHPELFKQDKKWIVLSPYWRITEDGEEVQKRYCTTNPWLPTTENPDLIKAYRKGLIQGNRQSARLADIAKQIWEYFKESYPNVNLGWEMAVLCTESQCIANSILKKYKRHE